MIVISFSVSMVAPILDGLVLNHTVEVCRLHEIFGGLRISITEAYYSKNSGSASFKMHSR